MAHNASMVRQSNILILIVYTLCLNRTPGTWLVVDNKCTLDVDLDSTGIGDSLLQTIESLSSRRIYRRDAIRGRHCGYGGKLERRGVFEVPVPTLTAYISFYPTRMVPLGAEENKVPENNVREQNPEASMQ